MMKPLDRSYLTGQVVAFLQEEIRTGRIPDEMPACRELASRLGVSNPTVLTALKRLADSGWLVPGGTRRPYRVAKHAGADPPKRRILIVSPQPLHALNGYTVVAVERLILECAGHGWETEFRVLDFSRAERPGRRWEEMIEKFRPTHLVAVLGTPVFGNWAKAMGLPVLFIGGSPGDSGAAAVGISLSACLRRLLPDLLDQGHLNFCLPVCGFPRQFVEAMREACREELQLRGLAFVPNYHTPSRAGGDGDALRDALKGVFATRMPSALIFTGMHFYLAALGMMQAHRPPQGDDPVVAVLTHEPGLDWMEPRPAHFRYPEQKLWQVVKHWLHEPDSPKFRFGVFQLEATYVPALAAF